MSRPLLLSALCLLAACSTTGTLSYIPTGNPALGAQNSVSAVAVIDHRDEKPNRVATIRGGYGNPLKVLDTPVPVSEIVASVFKDALTRRHMLSPDGPCRFELTLDTLYGDQYIGRKAEIKLSLAVFNQTGQPVYRDTLTDKDYEFTFFDNGIVSSIDDLRKRVEALLDRSVDQMLDKRALRAALTAAAPAGSGTPRS